MSCKIVIKDKNGKILIEDYGTEVAYNLASKIIEILNKKHNLGLKVEGSCSK